MFLYKNGLIVNEKGVFIKDLDLKFWVQTRDSRYKSVGRNTYSMGN